MAAHDGPGQKVVSLGVRVVSRDHREAFREALEDLLVDHLAAVLDGVAGVVPQGGRRPFVAGHADDGAVEHLAPLETVKGAEGHFFGQIAGNPEDDQDVCRRVGLGSHFRSLLR